MDFNSPAGLIAVLLMILSFYVTTYAVISLNVGWRFGYWLSASCFGAILTLLSVFWIITPVGPRGTDPIWIPVGAAAESVSAVEANGVQLTTPAQYPGGGWTPATDDDAEQRDALSSAIAACLTTAEEGLSEEEREACVAAQGLMPPDEDIPVLEGTEVSVQGEVEDVRFVEEGGMLLGQVTVVPRTHDPRVATDDPVAGKVMGDTFRIAARFNSGSVLVPAWASLFIFGLFTAFHLLGLHRAEQRKLSPLVT